MEIKFQVEFFVEARIAPDTSFFFRGTELIPQVGDGIVLPREESGYDSFIVCERRFILAQHGTHDNEAKVSSVRVQLAPKLP